MRIFNRVQGVHRRVTGFGADQQFASRRSPVRPGLPLSALTRIDVSVGKEFCMAHVKITHLPRPARDLNPEYLGTAAVLCVERSLTGCDSTKERFVERRKSLRPVVAGFRPFGASSFLLTTHGLRRGLHSFAAWRLESADFYSIARL